MTVSIYSATVPAYTRMLNNLSNWLDKAVVYANERKFDPDLLVTTRLAPDMRPLSFQVQTATDNVKAPLSRITGRDIPSWPDTEKTMADLKARVQKGLDFLGGFQESDLVGADERQVTIKIGGVDTPMSGATYVLQRGLPNFYFHVTTAYDILRHNGVPLGKSDFLGPIR